MTNQDQLYVWAKDAVVIECGGCGRMHDVTQPPEEGWRAIRELRFVDGRMTEERGVTILCPYCEG